MTRKKKKTSRRSTAAGNGLRPQLVLAGVVLTILSLAALFLVRGPATVEIPRPLQSDDLAVEIESILLRSGFTLEQIDVQREPGLLHYEVRGPMPATDVLDRLQARLQGRFTQIDTDRRPKSGELMIYRGGALAAVMQFEVGERPVPPPPPVAQVPQVAIIMDDLGRSLETARQLVDLDLKVTFSIIPSEPLATEVALLASRSHQEVMIHIPMEPQRYPEANPGEGALLLGQSAAEVRRRLAVMFKQVPYASGANNHMGSRYTEYPDGMRTVLETMREHGMFFVDSRTTSHSVVKREAAQIGVPTAERDVFLDNNADVEAIRTEIRHLIRRAQKQGTAIGICHPYPETIEALKQERVQLRDPSIRLVFASKLVAL